MSRKRPRQEWRLVDMMPEGLQAIFDEGSVAHTVVYCDDLEERMGLIAQQVVALLALNKALLTLGRPACTSLVEAVDVAQQEGLIAFRQAKYLRGLNRAANEAKHNPLPDPEEDDAPGSGGGQASGGGGGGGGLSPSDGGHGGQASAGGHGQAGHGQASAGGGGGGGYPHQMAGTETAMAGTEVGRVPAVAARRVPARRVPAVAAVDRRCGAEAWLGSSWTGGCAVGRKVGWPEATSPWRTGCVRIILTCGRSTNVGPGGEVSTQRAWRSIPTLEV